MPKGQTEKLDGRHLRGLATRARIIDGARSAFLERGFSGTTVAEIARRSGVSQPTVYYTFDGKEDILSAALTEAIAGGEPVPVAQQEWMQDLLADPDPVSQLSKTADGAAEILRRSAGLILVARAAAASGNATLAGLGATRLRQRLEFQRTCISALMTKTPLRSGLTPERAAEISILLLGPECYQLMTGDLGWPHDEWRGWARDCLIRELLPPAR